MTNEEHGQQFLEFVAKNEKRLKKNLMKNITYNEDIFDDVFQDSIVKVYNAIENGARIKDFEQYFFIASKFCYINADNKNKQKIKQMDRDLYGDIDQDERFGSEDNQWEKREEKSNKINELFKQLSDILNREFSPREADIFLIYYRLKSEKAGVSYKKMAKILDTDVKEISQIIQKVKKYVKNNGEIIKLKKQLLNGID